MVKREKTCYFASKIREKYSTDVENLCNAELTSIAVEMGGQSRMVYLEDIINCQFEAMGAKTVVLLLPKDRISPCSEYDKLSRTFLIGDTHWKVGSREFVDETR